MTIRNLRLSRSELSILLTCGAASCFAQNASSQAPPAAAPSLRWVCTTPAEPWKELSATVLSQPPSPASNVVILADRLVYQSIDGFGGCFNELGWEALQPLDAAQRATALKALFDASGCNFNLCRAPIGANDFALEWYSLDETPGDFAMTNFSIARDRKILIPFMKAAMQYQPKLAVWGVPWCPPSWMKTGNAYKGGNMKQDPQTLAAYALYFSKYVQAYRQEGINLYAVHPQNEPKYNNNVYPQCAWNGQEINTFLRDYLVPRLKKDNVNVQVWLGTIVNPNLADYITPVLGDSATAPAIAGVGYQYEGQNAMLATHQNYPDKKMLQTETECYNGANSWDEAATTFRKMIEDMNHFANGYMFWNMILSEKSTSTWGWKQNSLLKIDSQTKQIIYNPEFYAMKHFAHFVRPGAVRIAVPNSVGVPDVGGGVVDTSALSMEAARPSSTYPSRTSYRETAFGGQNLAAFRNPSGELILIVRNPNAGVLPITVQTGFRAANLEIPAHSMNTLVLTGW
jgi:glucosylceramidase